MKFLHTGDWHIGKKIKEFGLEEEQQAAFESIRQIAQANQVDAIVIAGDLYDSSRPTETAVSMLNQMLIQLNIKDEFPLIAINGNHDSAVRLGTGSQWYQATNFYLNTELKKAFEPVEFEDTEFFLVPYFKIQAARTIFGKDYQDIASAMKDVVAACEANFTPNKKHVFVGHFFAAGSTRTDSDTATEVGGLGAVPIDLFENFDYVALGHLHSKDALSAQMVKYSGSPLKFSASEANNQKGVWIVDTDTMQVDFVDIKPIHDLKRIKGSLDELTSAEYKVKNDLDNKTFVAVTLTDKEPQVDAFSRLSATYPRMFSLKMEAIEKDFGGKNVVIDSPDKVAPTEMMDIFFNEVIKQPLEEDNRKLLLETLKEAEEE